MWHVILRVLKMLDEDILVVKDLKKYYPIRGGLLLRIVGYVKAVDGVSFNVKYRETFGIVGESGCGKTTLARTILRLIEPTGGEIYFEGENILSYKGEKLKDFRRKAQIVFQNPYMALHPRKIVRDIVSEPLKIHTDLSKEDIYDRVLEMLEKVGLSEEHMFRYPHEFSGGQRQRIVIARALILNPKLLVLDEPTAALDVSVQAKILNLLKSLQKEFKTTYLLISHNLSIIDYMCDRIAVMYLGKFFEIASKRDLFKRQLHPYTKALISAIPLPEPDSGRRERRIILRGEVPSPINPPSGCYFSTRCPYAQPLCREEEPRLEEVDEGHFVACHYWRELEDLG